MTYAGISEFKVTLGFTLEELNAHIQLDSLEGLKPEDLDQLGRDAGACVSTRPGSIGVGASGPGIELIIAYASIPGDLLALMEVGKRIKSTIEKIKSRRVRSVTISDPDTMAAVASASATEDIFDMLRGTELRSVRNLFGGEPPNWNGTDPRHVWAVVFEHETQGYTVIIFMSPSGLVLSHTKVPLESYWDGTVYRNRSSEEILRFSSIPDRE